MDADTLRMMEDLGLARRDYVSVQDAKVRHVDIREQKAVLEGFEGRRQQIISAQGGSERDERLRAWNTETSFERDEITDQLENRYSGQAHRAGLAQRHSRSDNDRWDSTEARFGEERTLYLQNRAAEGNGAYVARAMSRAEHLPMSNARLSTPRSFSGGQDRNGTRGRVSASSAPNPNRAPSPRAFGTVRFAGGRRVGQAASPASNGPPPGPGLTSTPRAAPTPAGNMTSPSLRIPSATTTSTSASRAPSGPSLASTTAHSSRVPSAMSTTPTSRAASGPSANARPATQAPLPSAPSSAAGMPASTFHSAVEKQAYTNLAKHYAAHPGAECDLYYERHPEQREYLRPAVIELIKDAFRLSKNPNGSEATGYLQMYKERKWLFDEAMKAKYFVENNHEEELESYYAARPDLIDFKKAAKKYFTPQVSASDSAPASAVVVQQPVAAPTVQAVNVPAETTVQQVPEQASAPAIVSTTATAAVPEPAVSAAPVAIATPEAAVKEDISPPDSSNVSERSVETSVSEITPPSKGTISMSLFDVAGAFLKVFSIPIDAPIVLTGSLTSKDRRFNPHDLIPQLKGLAKSMEDASARSGFSATAGSVGKVVDGWVMTEDGLWEEA